MKKIFQFIKKRWYLLIIILLIAGFFYYRQSQQARINLEVNSFKVKKENIKETLSFSGQVEALEKASMNFQISGKLAWIGVKEGDKVKEYQTIAQLDQSETYKNLQKTLRDYSKQRNDFEQMYRATYNMQTPYSAISDTVKRVLEKNQWDLEKAVLDVELKDYSLKLATLTTPIAGIVTHIDSPVAGVSVVANQSSIDVINPETLYFSATADQTDVIKLKAEQKGTLVFDSYPNNEIPATITSIAFTPKEGETGTVYEIKIAFPADTAKFAYRLGMTGDINFILKERENIIAVPPNTLKDDHGNKYVQKIVNGKKVKTPVKVGEAIDSRIEVISGLSQGDIISYD